MFINNFDPVALQLFSLEIRWYSLAYIFGLIFGWIYCRKTLIKDEILKKLFEDYITYIIIGIIGGGRLGYVFFYNFSYFLKNPIEIFMIWNGGMSFHGALMGIIIASYFFSKKNNKEIFIFLDLVAVTAPIGIFFGRIANFINGELIGKVTSSNWGVVFPNFDNNLRHPSQLYEAFFEGLILFLILFFYFKTKQRKYFIGKISALFLIFYSLFRYLIEYLREPDYHMGLLFNYFSMGQLLCLPLFIAGFIILLRK